MRCLLGVHLMILYYHNALQTLKNVFKFQMTTNEIVCKWQRNFQSYNFLTQIYTINLHPAGENIKIILYKQMKDTSLLYQIVSCSSVSRYNIEHIYYLKNHFIIFLFGCNKKKLYYGVGLQWNYTVLKGCISYTERYIATIWRSCYPASCDKFLIIKPTTCTNFSNLFLEGNSACFGQRNCPKHVEFPSKNKFEKSVHLVGFIIRNCYNSCTTVKPTLPLWPIPRKTNHMEATAGPPRPIHQPGKCLSTLMVWRYEDN